MEIPVLKTSEEITKHKEQGVYPYLYEEYDGFERPMPFDMAFCLHNGNEELCHAAGMVLVEGPSQADCWNEYVDSLGDLHYGR